MNVIRWTFEKFGVELWQKVKMKEKTINFPEIEEESEGYIDLLKKMFY